MSAGLVLVKSNAEMDADDARRRDAEQQAEAPITIDTSLAAHIKNRWEVMRRHKEPIEKRMLDNLRQVAGRYSDAKLAEIEAQGLPGIYMQITSVKARAAKSWIRDVLMPAGDRPWQIKPSQRPDLSPQEDALIDQTVRQRAMMQMQQSGQQFSEDQLQRVFKRVSGQMREARRDEADQRADRMSNVIEDQLIGGGWETTLNDVISDVVDFPAGIMKAPVMRNQRKIQWGQGGQPEVQSSVQPMTERVDPFRFYPAPNITHPDEGDCCEVHDYSADEVHRLIGLPGYDEAAIRRVLQQYATSGLTIWTQDALRTSKQRARGEFSGSQNERNTIEALEYWGDVKGSELLEWGVPPEHVPDEDAMHAIMAVMIGQEVVCVRFNPDPLGRKPYSKACFEPIPGSFWGKGVPDLIKDCQDVCNAAARALVANMGISSGPQVAVNTQSLAPGQDISTLFPWKIWQLDFTKTGSSSQKPIDFFQPKTNVKELMDVFKEYSSLADEYSGIPSYSYGVGSDVGGAGKTASGLSMLMNAASKSIKNVIKQLDMGVIQPVVHRFYVHNMQWHDDQSIKGDANVIARGALSLVAKEQNQMRLQELLAQTANPLDHEILGNEGRAAMLRAAMEGVDAGAGSPVPDDEELREREHQKMQQQMMLQAQQQGAAPGQSPEQRPGGQPMQSQAPPA